MPLNLKRKLDGNSQNDLADIASSKQSLDVSVETVEVEKHHKIIEKSAILQDRDCWHHLISSASWLILAMLVGPTSSSLVIFKQYNIDS